MRHLAGLPSAPDIRRGGGGAAMIAPCPPRGEKPGQQNCSYCQARRLLVIRAPAGAERAADLHILMPISG
jgi:hypothetical protein